MSFFAYIGFDAVSTAAQETAQPRCDLIYKPSAFLARACHMHTVLLHNRVAIPADQEVGSQYTKPQSTPMAVGHPARRAFDVGWKPGGDRPPSPALIIRS